MQKMLGNEKVRFVLVGCFNTGMDFLLLNFFVMALGLNTVVANTISVLLCITFSYYLNHKFVFRSPEPISLKKYASFFAVTGFSSLIMQDAIIYGFSALTNSSFGHSLFVLKSISEHKGLELNVAKAIAVGVGMVWNFLLYKYVVFKNKPTASDIDIEAKIYE